jgi:hypothetical protein
MREKCGISTCLGAPNRKRHVGRIAILKLTTMTALNITNRRTAIPLKYLKTNGKNRKGRKMAVNKLEQTTHIAAITDRTRFDPLPLTRYRSRKKNAIKANSRATIVVIWPTA